MATNDDGVSFITADTKRTATATTNAASSSPISPTYRLSQPVDLSRSGFERLPDEIVQQILQATEPSSFASLVVLNSKWRRVSQQAPLYAHQLSKCPSFAASHRSFSTDVDDEKLPELRSLFAKEVKRNLFQAFLRPNETVVKLISNSISSSSCPGGEGLQFSPSPKGTHLLAFNSSRIYVIDVSGPELDVKRELKILRRPSSTRITDDGSLLAILSTDMQVDLYDLTKSPPKRTHSLILDNSPRAIALSPCGSVLAAAYEGGIEVSSLSATALATDRRAVKCDGVDALAFSFDGTQILGTTINSNPPNTVILTAPYYDPGSHMPDETISGLWTTSILFPNTSRDCSHAVLLQESGHEEAYWTLTYDRSFETFRAVHVDDLRNGTTYFTGPAPTSNSPSKLLPCTLPSTTYSGEVFSAGFQGKEIWIYGVPENLDAVPEHSAVSVEGSPNPIGRRSSGISLRPSSRIQENSGARPPQWQVLCDKLRHTFVTGAKVATLDGVSMVKWVGTSGQKSLKERLVVAAKGVMPPKPITEEDDVDFVDGGRITLLDFEYGFSNGKRTEITIEVGTKEPEVLEEERRDMDTEVAIVRRRTVAQRRGNRGAVSRAATTASRRPPIPAPPPLPQPEAGTNDDDDPLIPRRLGQLRPPATAATNTSTGETTAPGEEGEEGLSIEEQEALDAPYAHASPRSGTTLRRAATAAAMSRRLHPPAAGRGRYEYRRADGRREHPHESDADNWVPPPPPYQKEDPQDLPAFLRNAVIDNGGNVVTQPTASVPPQTTNTAQSQWTPPRQATRERGPQQQQVDGRDSQPASRQRTQPQVETPQVAMQNQQQHTASGSTSSPTSGRGADEPQRPTSSWTVNTNSLYDVSPPDSPTTPAAVAVATATVSTSPSIAPSQSRRRISASSNIVSPAIASPERRAAPLPPVPRLETSPTSLPRSVPVSQGPPAPTLNLAIPSPTLNNLMWNNGPQPSPGSATGPSIRRLSNSQTWPTNPSAPAPAAPTGFPYSAPATGPDMVPGSVMAPRQEQMASLFHHEHGSPQQRYSTTFMQRVPVGSRSGSAGNEFSGSPPSQPQSPPMPHNFSHPRRPMYPEPDQPLIVSTPAGVQGAFDPPDRRISARRTEMPILAPVPRHPRPTRTGPVRPTVERLEGMYNPQPQMPQPGGGQRFLNAIGGSFLNAPPQLTPTSTSSAQRHASVKRRKSRASRSAQKNLQDAKKKGWNGGQKPKKRRAKDSDAVSSAAWTDVSRSTTGHGDEKDKKCVVM
ncbi:hypothetical protein MKZ38_006369 [Zalerion maritima]|uniref:F-box domain-containing protein n=1 Tax=Zalerion maritima TaxID=339359 RepID=A0AAD5S3K1_9PEZI|nr:hypothetical protein MKZ38_006369 [Zalerion maritima]